MKLQEAVFDEFAPAQNIVNITMWMLQGLAMSPDNEKLIQAYQAVLAVFNSDK